MDAAGCAKGVVRNAGVELVGGEVVGAAFEVEVFARHDEVQEAFLGADGAVALRGEGEVAGDAELDAPTMAAAAVGFEHFVALISGVWGPRPDPVWHASGATGPGQSPGLPYLKKRHRANR